ncbi:MAG: DUF452 family protein [Tannerellaceae bacterium]|jgi:biotin synthesis protein BioG|nr:DUF452 family protein [Tannerellaceae bacterium]
MIVKRITPIDSSRHPSQKLLLFFAGWGMDENPFAEYCNTDCDFMITYDYDSLSFDDTFLKSYNEIKIVAWSMGVWAASQLLQDKDFPVVESTAINGTIFPIDDKKGIPDKIFDATLNNLNENTLYKFQRRMCGSSDALKRFLDKPPTRGIDSLRKELTSIGKSALSPNASNFNWSKVYISNRDKIFPPENQLRAWEGANYTVIDEEHYPEKLFKELFDRKIQYL